MKQLFWPVILLVITISCKNEQTVIVSESDVDSSKIIYQSAFRLCSLNVEGEKIEIERELTTYFHKNKSKRDTLIKKTDELATVYDSEFQHFVSLTEIGNQESLYVESYAYYIRIKYLEEHIPSSYFSLKRDEIFEVFESDSSTIVFHKNPHDTTDFFCLSSQTIEVLNLIQVDIEALAYESLKMVNIWIIGASRFRKLDFFPVFIQNGKKNCGPSCLKMIGDHYGKYYSVSTLSKMAKLDTVGTNLENLRRTAYFMGFNADIKALTYDELHHETVKPAVVYWNSNHFVVVYETTSDSVLFSDPAKGHRKMEKEEFCSLWMLREGKATDLGAVLTLDP
ncbi:MAG: cysteine peptidase family C39 domain-containing protein [Crocinitomicaceae bacterium]